MMPCGPAQGGCSPTLGPKDLQQGTYESIWYSRDPAEALILRKLHLGILVSDGRGHSNQAPGALRQQHTYAGRTMTCCLKGILATAAAGAGTLLTTRQENITTM